MLASTCCIVVAARDDNDLGPDNDNLGPDNRNCWEEDDCFDDLSIDDDDEVEGESSVADRGETSPGLFIKSWNAIYGFGKTVVTTVYNISTEALEDIADILRIILNEEAYNMFVSAGQSFVDSVINKDNLLGMTFSAASKTVLSFSLLLMVLLLNYILCGYLSVLTIVAFDGFVFLIHGIFGPVFIARRIIDFGSWVYYILKWMITYPYLFAFILVSIFIFSCCWPCIRRILCPRRFRSTSDIIHEMDRRLISMERRLENMEGMLKTINRYIAQNNQAQNNARNQQ